MLRRRVGATRHGFYCVGVHRSEQKLKRLLGSPLLSGLWLLLFCAVAAQAFGKFGTTIHRDITTTALRPLGFDEASLEFIHLGNRTQDKFYLTGRFKDSRRHFVNEDFEGGREWLRSRRLLVAQTFEDAPADFIAYRRALFLWGGLLHAAQDFYAHSNWVELQLNRGQNPALVDWEQPDPDLKLAYFLARTFPPEQLLREESYEAAFEMEFLATQKLDGLTPKARVRRMATTDLGLTHPQLSKDHPDSPQGRLVYPGQGASLYRLASRLATGETKRQWRLLEPELSPPQKRLFQAGWTAALSNGDPGEIRPRSLQLYLDGGLTSLVKVTFECDRWNRATVDRAVRTALELTHSILPPQRLLPEGARPLRLVRDRDTRTVTFSYRANPYGLEQGVGSIRPTATGDYLLRLQPELKTISQIEVQLPSRVLQTTGEVRGRSVSFRDADSASIRFSAEGIKPPKWFDSLVDSSL